MPKKGYKQTKEHREKGAKSRIGTKRSAETKRKMSVFQKNRIHCSPSEKTKRKMSESQKGRKHSEETKHKIGKSNLGKHARITSEETKEKMRNNHIGMLGKHHSEETKEKLKQYTGDKSSNWKDGISFDPYCEKFNEKKKEEIREEYNRKCYNCGKDEKDNITKTNRQFKLSVHHIDNDKQQGCNGKLWKLIPLCLSCHNNKKWKFYEK